ncbi:MAG: sensor histidine kinase [Acidobacteria bacterium]|nr:MAG: sensor histidine kinase [Acidobacteriota bacterium]
MDRLLFITLLLNLAVIAAIAAVLVRSVAFQRCLYAEHRRWRERLAFTLFVALPLMGGVWIRLAVPSFHAADVSLAGALLLGLMGGYRAGLLGGAIIAFPAAVVGHEWLTLPLLLLAGWVGGLLRHAAPNLEEVWAFSPFIDLELWRWLRNRLNRPFRDWQALVFALVIACTLLELELQRLAPDALFAPQPGNFWTVVAVVVTNILALAIPIKIWANTRMERKFQAQQRLLVQARLDALTSQINPHFLFNTLNSVASLVRFDPDTARVLIVKLSNILRRMLRKHESFLPLRDEVAFMDDYLDIEIVRFGPEKLRFEKVIEPDMLDRLVPSMLLQPVVENSIRHGLAPKVEGGWVRLRARQGWRHQHEVLELEVEDNGVGLQTGPPVATSEPGHGIGLANVRERLRVLYGDTAQMEIRSRPEEGTLVRFVLPRVELGAPDILSDTQPPAGVSAPLAPGP